MAKILLYCCDKVGKSMAGPAIRYWELAKALSATHEVTLYVMNEPDICSEHFRLVSKKHIPLGEVLSEAEIMMTQFISGRMAVEAKRHGVKIILDAYAPEPLEHLEIFRFGPLEKRNLQAQKSVKNLSFALKMADGVICANHAQRDLWTGFLMGMHQISPHLYDQDPSLKNFIEIVPFGLSSQPPQKEAGILRKLFNLSPNDFVLVWGGGIWNWFDPLTLIHAIKKVSITRPGIRLVFMGTQHPNEKVPQMKMVSDAIKLAEKLGLLNKHVFFNKKWIPYNERGGYLLDADIGISTHFNHLETRYAFRTRILDYLWSGLPILATEGDCFSELINKHALGMTVPFENSDALAEAICLLWNNEQQRKEAQKNIAGIRPGFYWENVAKPLHGMIERLTCQPRQKRSLYASLKDAGGQFCKVYGIKNIFKTACKKVFKND